MGVATTRNKYGATRTWSELAQRELASKAEAARADELVLLQRAGEISGLEFQPVWVLCGRPRVTYTADFRYFPTDHLGHGEFRGCDCVVVEDVKGVLTRDVRTKLAWLRAQHGVTVTLLRQSRGGFEEVPWLGREPKRKRGARPA